MSVCWYHTGSGLECYYCGHDHEEECNNDIAGEKVICQTEDEAKEHYGNTCYVGHDGMYDQRIIVEIEIIVILKFCIPKYLRYCYY